MNVNIHYACSSHKGKCRSMNQDNFICDGRYMDSKNETFPFPLTGTIANDQPSIVGVFDGMGGLEYGEIASFIAAKCAAETPIGANPVDDLLAFCRNANDMICDYATETGAFAMGTTAAMLVFAENEIALCNIGDSKIFRFSGKKLEQISTDHCSATAYGSKPPLSQNLGIPASEMRIEPYVAKGWYHAGDCYLICSDGLTDMVSVEAIAKVLLQSEFAKSISILQEMALENGGKDNITMILCKVEREKQSLFRRIFRKITKEVQWYEVK